MTRRVWFKLPDKPVGFAPLEDGVDCMFDLREAVVAQYLTRAVRDRVKLYASPEAQKASRPLHLETKVDKLGLEREHPIVVIVVEAPRMRQIPPVSVIMHGLRLETPRLERTQLLDRVATSLLRYPKRFILFAAPSGSGKTSLLLLFAHNHKELSCTFVPLIAEGRPTNEVLRDKVGLDICRRECALSKDEQHVILIDDAETKYEDRAFWKALITDSPSWLPSNIRFIIAADHALDGGVESPIEFQSLRTFGWTDFLLSNEEAYELLALPYVGFPEEIKYGTEKLAQLLVRDCGGLIGAMLVALTWLTVMLTKTSSTFSESELMAHFLSYPCLESMKRCFGRPAKPTSKKFHQFLTKCLASAPSAMPLDSELAKKNRRCILDLKKCGVLVQDSGEKFVQFSSPVAERYYFDWIKPTFAYFDPGSLRELVTLALGSISSSALRSSVDVAVHFPDRVTFQQQLMNAIAVNTYHSCLICPELPRVLPAAAADEEERGFMVFFVNAKNQKWGLEVFVDDENAQDYTSQFAPGGRYGALEVDDFAVVDLRGNANAEIPDGITPKEKVFTVLFKLGDFSRCQCVFGMDEERCDIDLS